LHVDEEHLIRCGRVPRRAGQDRQHRRDEAANGDLSLRGGAGQVRLEMSGGWFAAKGLKPGAALVGVAKAPAAR